MKKKILSVLMLGVMALSIIGCGSTESSGSSSAKLSEPSQASTEELEGSMKGVTVKIGTSGLFGPFSYYDTDGKTLIGYDIDLINDLQKILGFEIDGGLKSMDYSALTTSVVEGKLDVGAAALCATDERKAVMDFSETYCDSGLTVMVNKDNDQGIKGIDSLAGKTVAVEKGTASHIYAQKNLSDAKIEVHDTITTAYESLEQKKVDAVIQDAPGCAFYIKTTEGTAAQVVGDEFNKGQSPYAVAYNKDFKYKDQFNAALEKLRKDGELDKLYDKWCK